MSRGRSGLCRQLGPAGGFMWPAVLFPTGTALQQATHWTTWVWRHSYDLSLDSCSLLRNVPRAFWQLKNSRSWSTFWKIEKARLRGLWGGSRNVQLYILGRPLLSKAGFEKVFRTQNWVRRSKLFCRWFCFLLGQAGCISFAAWTHLKLASYYFVASGGLIACR